MHVPGKPERLTPRHYERVWGSTQLEPWFPDSSARVGEVWFHRPDSPVLVKFLFATEHLSVQVHPGDLLAQRHGHPRGKTEMWHILATRPDARIALGFNAPLTPDLVRRAAADGSIMNLLHWIPVHPGETWFIPAGAVHAIGAGVTLCEVQQNSDVTYRLYDYGRNRPLHLEESLEAMDLAFAPNGPTTRAGLVVDCPYFEVHRIDLEGTAVHPRASLAIALEGSGELNGMPFRQGEVFETAGQPVSMSGKGRLLTVLTKT